MPDFTTHLLLTTGADRNDAQRRIQNFFAKNFLVKYDRVTIPAECILGAGDGDFWPQVDEGVGANRRVVEELLGELAAGGFAKLTDLLEMHQGYESKLLHVITHLLDGFFGIDTVFFNLAEDSHGLSERLIKEIKGNPGGFWLVTAECASAGGGDANQLDSIRRFESEPPH